MPPGEAVQNKQGFWEKSSRIWVPDEAKELKLKVTISAHCGIDGHRKMDGTENEVEAEFTWSDLINDVSEFVQQCEHRIMTRNKEQIPRSLAKALHAQRPNEERHMNSLYMGPEEKPT